MSTIKNPATYEQKAPTNLRLEPEIKDRLIAQAEKMNLTLSALINQILDEALSQLEEAK